MAENKVNENLFPVSSKTGNEEEEEDDKSCLPSYLSRDPQQSTSSRTTAKIDFLMNRHKTSPNILNVEKENDTRRTNSSVLLPVKAVPRKSFFGELKNILTFKKKNDVEDTREDGTSIDDANLSNKSKDATSSFARGRRKADFFGNKNEDALKEGSKNSLKEQGQLQKATETINTLQMSIKKWKLMKATEKKRETIATNSEHQRILDDAMERFLTEVPHPLQVEIKEEALQIVTKTMQMYKSMLGDKHKLTKEAKQHINYIKTTLREPAY